MRKTGLSSLQSEYIPRYVWTPSQGTDPSLPFLGRRRRRRWQELGSRIQQGSCSSRVLLRLYSWLQKYNPYALKHAERKSNNDLKEQLNR